MGECHKKEKKRGGGGEREKKTENSLLLGDTFTRINSFHDLLKVRDGGQKGESWIER